MNGKKKLLQCITVVIPFGEDILRTDIQVPCSNEKEVCQVVSIAYLPTWKFLGEIRWNICENGEHYHPKISESSQGQPVVNHWPKISLVIFDFQGLMTTQKINDICQVVLNHCYHTEILWEEKNSDDICSPYCILSMTILGYSSEKVVIIVQRGFRLQINNFKAFNKYFLIKFFFNI